MIANFKNIEIYYKVSGNSSGSVIVWLHGFMENVNIWINQMEYFNTDYKNIRIDLLGHGYTQNISEIHSMELQAEAVKFVLDKLNITSFSIVGHSMGGYAGLALLEKFPKMTEGIVLLNSTSYADSEEKKINRDRAIKLVNQNKEAFLRMSVINLFSASSRKKYAQEIDGLIETFKDISLEGITAALLGMKIRPNRSKILKNYTGKKMIIAGISDNVIFFENSQNEAKKINSEFIALKGGHMSFLEAFEDANNYIRSFLEG